MSSYGDDSDSRRARRIIEDRQERLEAVLDMFSRQAADVQLDPQMKREIAVHIVNYHRVLSNFHGESVLSDGDIPDITPIRQRLGQTAKVLSPSGRRGGNMGYEERPAIDELDFWYLEKLARQLEAASKKLGFWASASTDVERDKFSEEDLATLVNTRGQTDAVDDMPDDIRERIDGPEVSIDGD